MSNGRFVQEYQKSAVNGASPLQLVIMLYDGALRFMEAGKAAMQAKDLERQNFFLQKAQRIVTELMACLDMKQGGEVAQNLLALYTYVLNELVTANVQDDPQRIDICMRTMADLRQSWGELEANLRTQVLEDIPLAA